MSGWVGVTARETLTLTLTHVYCEGHRPIHKGRCVCVCVGGGGVNIAVFSFECRCW